MANSKTCRTFVVSKQIKNKTMGKRVKNSLVLLVQVPNYKVKTAIIVTYDYVFKESETNWNYKEYLPWCKQTIHVRGHYRKDKTLALKGIEVAVSERSENLLDPVVREQLFANPIKFRKLQYD